VGDVRDIGLGIVAPDGKAGMQAHAEEFARAGIPFVFDPGQGLPLFDGPELLAMIERAAYLTVNDYEAKLLSERTGLSLAELAERVEALVVTQGAEGSVIHAGGATYPIPAVKPAAVVDPTGCGDAYRAGLLYGVAHKWDWARTGRLAAGVGSRQRAAARSRRCWARSRSRRAAARTTRSTARASPRCTRRRSAKTCSSVPPGR